MTNRERIIFDNRSSKPMYEVLTKAYDVFFYGWEDGLSSLIATLKDSAFFVKKNKASVTIIIQDLKDE